MTRSKDDTMTVRPYPSNTFILNIDERLMSRDLKLALKRSWAHVGDTVIRTHALPDHSAPRNHLQVLIKFGARSYLLSSSEDADANWEERLEKHISSTIAKVGNNTKIFNRNQRKVGQDEVAYDYIEMSLESGALILQFRLDSNSDLPIGCARIATQVRDLLNKGAYGEKPKRIIIPSPQSFRQQEARFLETVAEREAQKAAEEEAACVAARELRMAAEVAAEERFLESPELSEGFAEEREGESGQGMAGITPLTAEEWEAEYGFDDADFAIDYRIWEVVYEDGSSRTFDSLEESFIA